MRIWWEGFCWLPSDQGGSKWCQRTCSCSPVGPLGRSWHVKSRRASRDFWRVIPLNSSPQHLLASNRGFANVASSLLQSNAMVDYQNEQVMNASALVQSSQQGHVDAWCNDDVRLTGANKVGKLAVVSDNHFRASFLFPIFFSNWANAGIPVCSLHWHALAVVQDKAAFRAASIIVHLNNSQYSIQQNKLQLISTRYSFLRRRRYRFIPIRGTGSCCIAVNTVSICKHFCFLGNQHLGLSDKTPWSFSILDPFPSFFTPSSFMNSPCMSLELNHAYPAASVSVSQRACGMQWYSPLVFDVKHCCEQLRKLSQHVPTCPNKNLH